MKNYEKPIMEIVAVTTPSIITQSSGGVVVEPTDDVITNPGWTD